MNFDSGRLMFLQNDENEENNLTKILHSIE